MRLQLIISCKKRAPFFAFFFYVTRANMQQVLRHQCKLICTRRINEWCKIFTIKTLMEVNKT